MKDSKTSDDPTYCKRCNAALSSISSLKPSEGGSSWKCEFCSATNSIDVKAVPSSSVMSYVPDFVPSVGKKTSPMVIFCIDTSWSMKQSLPIKDGTEVDIRAIDLTDLSEWKTEQINKSWYYNPKTNESVWEIPIGNFFLFCLINLH